MWKRSACLVAFVASCASPSNAAPTPVAPVAAETGPTSPKPGALAIPVSVVNLPAVQPVVGTVSVGNLPIVQDVTGQVTVANLPLDGSGNLRVSAAGPRVFRFVGLTSVRLAGNAGRAAMNAACNADYPGSRLAFAEEYANTPNAAPVPETAWIQPRIVGGVTFTDGNPPRFFDSSGTTFAPGRNPSGYYPFTFDCTSWTTNSTDGAYVGVTLSPNGAVEISTCARQPTPVACSAPD